MQRYGDDGVRLSQQELARARHHGREKRGQFRPVSMLEGQDERLCCLIIDQCRAGTRESRLPMQTAKALPLRTGLAQGRESEAAALAERCRDEIQPAEAGGAESVRPVDRGAAERALRG